MSTFGIHSVCRDAFQNPDVRSELAARPEQALDGYDLQPDERAALLRGDVAELYRLGAHELALSWLARAEVLGLTVPLLLQRITQAEPRYVY